MSSGPKEFHPERLPGWARRHPASSLAALLAGTDSSEKMERYVLQMRERNIGYCYITDGRGANPWNRLPRYWEAEVEAVQAVNAQKSP